MSGSHDLSVQNLRLHERIVEEERQNKRVVESANSAVTARHSSARPPAKPATVVTCQADSKMGYKAGSKMGSKAGSKAEPKTGSKHQTSHHNKEVLVVTVIEEEEGEEEEETLPPKAPSLSSKHKPAHEAKPPAFKVSSHHHSQHSNHRNKNCDIYHIPTGIPLPPGFSKVRPVPKEANDMALVKLPSLVPAAKSTVSAAAALSEKQVTRRYPPASSHVGSSSSSHHSKTSSRHTKTKVLEDGGDGGGGGGSRDFRDVVFEEVRQVTKRRYVIGLPADEIGEWRF
ncbi:hypothetical protein E4T50_06342 [Aureobasidium sp. EXF-12298]|nr:hypothetical protein E4T50_06342 [Aureobasidium sp. EXF-12298]KAI4753879.1 hypothetical protein E4T51_12990 [Aureobasidium sp. EXF-12344]KAI4777784.1 hypothetical protein E4T52_07300 [Aureobasidium sp. EXF-3400]